MQQLAADPGRPRAGSIVFLAMGSGRIGGRGRRGRPPLTGGGAAMLLQVRLAERARKAALVDEAEALGLPLSEYVERILFALSPARRARLASAPTAPRTVDERIANR